MKFQKHTSQKCITKSDCCNIFSCTMMGFSQQIAGLSRSIALENRFLANS